MKQFIDYLSKYTGKTSEDLQKEANEAMLFGAVDSVFADLKAYCNDIQADWNGKDVGLLEERAELASDILSYLDELEATIEELKSIEESEPIEDDFDWSDHERDLRDEA